MVFEKEDEILDDSWINDFENNDKPYNDFYKDDIHTVNINILYVNKNNDIEKVSEEVFFMKTPNVISREEIIGLIKKRNINNGNDYSLLSILKYNITLNPEDVNSFSKSKPNNFDDYNSNFLTTIKHIDTIFFDKTIITFQDINTLFIIFYEKNKDNSTRNNNSNTTKKIYLRRRLNSNNKKTIRN
jgi:hypothetical protein